MAIDKKELKTRLWKEWVDGIKNLAYTLGNDYVQITDSACTTVLGNENFIQKAVMYVQRKTYIGKFKDYKVRIAAYEASILELIDEVNRIVAGGKEGESFISRCMHEGPTRIEYQSTLGDIIIDGDDSFENADWGDHAIAAYEKLNEYVLKLLDVLDRAQKELEK